MRSKISLFLFCAFNKRFSRLSSPLVYFLRFYSSTNDLSVSFVISYNALNCSCNWFFKVDMSIGNSDNWVVLAFTKSACFENKSFQFNSNLFAFLPCFSVVARSSELKVLENVYQLKKILILTNRRFPPPPM
jgi:hypothetical protein